MTEVLREKILIVDDMPENIDILVALLEKKYQVIVATNGIKALAIAKKTLPDLILLDIMMPLMGGFEVCSKLKNDKSTMDIPIIFLTAMGDVEDKMKGFNLGAVDYITKPFQVQEVNVRVKTQIELKKSKQASHELLTKTLSGSVKTLVDILSVVNPVAFSQGSRIKNYVKQIVEGIGISDIWQFEIAAILSQVGCYTLPVDLLEKVYSGKKLTLTEKQLFSKHPAAGSKLVSNIPGLEAISTMIARQQEPLGKEYENTRFVDRDYGILGAQILNIAINFDLFVNTGGLPTVAIDKMREQAYIYDTAILDVFERTLKRRNEINIMNVSLDMLKPGMIAEDGILSNTGTLLIAKGTEISDYIKEHLVIFNRKTQIKEPIKVRVPENTYNM